MSAVILNVDDRPEALYLKTTTLRRAGYRVIEARTGGAALEAITVEVPDLVLLDVVLPDIDGLEVCRRIKEDPKSRHVPVLQLSAIRVADVHTASGLRSGADLYLTEPVGEEALLGVVSTLLLRGRWSKEREDLLAAARRAQDELERANAAKDKLLSIVSHELRDPLNAALSWLTLYRSGNLDSGQRERALDTIERNLKTQAYLINQLLDLSRMSAGQAPLRVEPVALHTVVTQAIDDIRPSAKAKGVCVNVRSDMPVVVEGDRQRLAQVVKNLLTNAVKYTPAGGCAAVTWTVSGDRVDIAVSDTGIGLAADQCARIFEPFSRVDSGESSGGLGLGLAIAAEIIKRHGGQISAQSAGVGHGSTFTITLPLGQTRST